MANTHHHAIAGMALLRVLIGLGIGSIVLAVAVDITLILQRQLLGQRALAQANQRAQLIMAELARGLANTEHPPERISGSSMSGSAVAHFTLAQRTEEEGPVRMDYRYSPSRQQLSVKGQSGGFERLSPGVLQLEWAREPRLSGGWLRLITVSDAQVSTLPVHLRRSCSADPYRACVALKRFIALTAFPVQDNHATH